ncbi:MAG: SAM-dependent DNA methyltransferase [Deltaproteobacteria bacterium]|nr:SAM-dependent DNA methyltransferase [Deltaproteobacteria bacterium]MBW2737570.1 SAM-dependent DNA methyltransferase [Deltaproteobacteria bacterium]
MEKQVVSKQRVADHGEVLTGKREVNAMLDLVKQETERIDSRFLEPACGTGNFLTEILERKLRVVETRYKKSQLEYERNAVLAMSSIYGIDILEDNVKQCRYRLCEIFEWNYARLFKNKTKNRCQETVRFILERNILWGDALSLKTVDDNSRPIVFSKWSPVNGSMLKRHDFSFKTLLMCAEKPKQMSLFNEPEQLNLFSDLGDYVLLPKPVKEYPLTHFLEVANAYE